MNFILKIQRFIRNLSDTILSLIKWTLLAKKVPYKDRIFSQRGNLLILGNGPSLSVQVESLVHLKTDYEFVCVNHFPSTALYEKLKPRFYFTTALDLWLEDIDQKFIDNSNKMFNNMAAKTTWHLDLYIPFNARKYSRWQSILTKNNNIHIHYFNNIGFEGFAGIQHYFFKTWKGMPRPHNVLITSIYLGINLGFKKIILCGSDHSWLKEISVNKDNVALINQKHFYDELVSKPDTLDKAGIGNRKLHEILHKFMHTFRGYFILKEYATKMNVEVLNATSGSMIDAFDRIEIKDIIND